MFSRTPRAMPINANHPSSSSVTSSDQKKTKLNGFLVNTCMVTITVSGKRFHVQSYSDQACPYTSQASHDIPLKVGLRNSMSRRGKCPANASMESFFSHLKAESPLPCFG